MVSVSSPPFSCQSHETINVLMWFSGALSRQNAGSRFPTNTALMSDTGSSSEEKK